MSATLDGNALGGILLEVFGVDVTGAFGTCAYCGSRGEVARMVVYVRCPGMVGRCRACGEVLVQIVEAREQRYVALHGLRSLEVPRHD